MRTLKEKGWKPVSNDAFKIYNIYRRSGWVATIAIQQTSVNLTFFKKEYLLQFCYIYFHFAKLTIKFSIIYDNA